MTETTLSRMDDPDLQKLDTPESRAELAKRSAERARLNVKPPATCASEAGESAVAKASADLVNAPKGSFRDGGVVPPKAAIVGRPDGVSTGGHKNDAGKPPLALLPWEALIDVAKVLDAGAAKYTTHKFIPYTEIDEWVRQDLLASVLNAGGGVACITSGSSSVAGATTDISGRLGLNTPEKRVSGSTDGRLSIQIVFSETLKNSVRGDRLIQRLSNATAYPADDEGFKSSEPMSPKLRPSLHIKATAAAFAGAVSSSSEQFTSTTIIRPARSEECYALVATTASECLEMAKTFCVEQSLISGNHLPSFTDAPEGVNVIFSGAHNWRKGVGYHRLLDAQMRHLAAFTMGEDFDPETGLSHLAHAACCNLFLLAFVVSGRTDLDDRYRAAVEK